MPTPERQEYMLFTELLWCLSMVATLTMASTRNTDVVLFSPPIILPLLKSKPTRDDNLLRVG